ncbi:MAG: tRNA (adenosine(37)-N6)-threonylcarbamoyltransferase complex ATPase subunit type 1 TsaE [Candidatus Berkelbacteria bacterium]|nr:MAG: tRNA (adenosine(37)-N6)-threonylcarbamoyltransferase complex ATPase subunit type 1 TsaE [Candidatus Berkelbacteria bacterium]QQG51990.1 MAG: tRNA (adenosine(37)-N6)-threonylcarbamoyltransferase complex ATPase subunit type 1 TsaE [Candidatus Berkelbacteria bacterium]
MEINEEGLLTVAKKVVGSLHDGDVIALSGPLASGKTSLVKHLVAAMGYAGRVSSPTFVLERRYPVEWQGVKEVLHLDFYRLTAEEIESFDWQDHIGDRGTIAFIEWPEIAAAHLPKKAKTISLEIIDDKTRRITFSNNFGF